MPAISKFKGHDILFIKNKWVFLKSGKAVELTWKDTPCGYCGKGAINEHDVCLGTLPGIQNACCGHGIIGESYIQFSKHIIFRGVLSKTIIEMMKIYNKIMHRASR